MNQRDNKRSVSELLLSWLKGDLRSREERELYHAAKDDPFLNEALQGYEGLPEGKHLDRIASIKSKLNRQKKRGIILPIRIAVAAASIMLVAFSAWWIVQTPSSDLASAEPSEQVEEEASATEESMTPLVADEIQTEEPEPKKNTGIQLFKKQEDTSPKLPAIKLRPAEPEVAELEKEEEDEIEELALDISPPSPPPPSPTLPTEEIKPPPAPVREESVASGQSAAKKKSDKKEITLQEYEQVTPSARSRQMQKPSALQVPVQDMEAQPARPLGGFDALENYLDSAWQKPWQKDSLTDAYEFIGLEFEVLKDGTLTNFLITNPSTPNGDSSFIQLLRQGPKWEYVHPNVTQPVKVKYRFPKKN